jgi:acid phosphatase (class A)
MKKVSILCVVLSAFVFSGFKWQLNDPYYLSKDAVDVATALPPPPTHGSDVEKSDFDTLKQFQKTRTKPDCERAEYEVEVSLEHLFGPKYGPLTQPEVEKLQAFVDKARNDTDWFVQKVKKQWSRPRPYFTDPTITPCVKREQTNAYPSGHASIAEMMADLLSQWDPSRAAQFHARAEVIRHDRVMAGVHHPSDIEAGKKLGDELFKKLEQVPAFEADLQSLKIGKIGKVGN